MSLREAAEKIRELASGAKLEKYVVTSVIPFQIEQVDGDEILTEGDDDVVLGDLFLRARAQSGVALGTQVRVLRDEEGWHVLDMASERAVLSGYAQPRVYVGADEPTYVVGYYLWVHLDGDDVYLMVEADGEPADEGDGSGRFFVGPDEPPGPSPWAWAETDGDLPLPLYFDPDGSYADLGRRFFVGPTQPTYANYPCVWIQTGFGDPDGFTLWLIEDV